MKRLTLLALLGSVSLLFGQSAHKAAPEPKFSELTREDSERLNRQRAIVAAAQAAVRHSSTVDISMLLPNPHIYSLSAFSVVCDK